MSSKDAGAMSEENGEKSALVPRLRFPEFRDAGLWQLHTQGSIGETISGLSGKSAEDFGKGSPFITYKQIFENSFVVLDKCGFVKIKIGERQNEVSYGDILITSSSETPEEVGFASVVLEQPSDKTYLNSFCFAFRPKPLPLCNPKFSQFLFHSPWYRAEVTNLAQGSTRFNISKSSFLKLKLPVPNKGEQQKIADCLSSLDELIAAETHKLDALKTHKKGLMQRLFPREGETVPRLRFPEFREVGEWKERLFGALLDDIIDFRGRTPTKLGMEWGDGTIPALSANNVKNGFIDYNAECYVASEELHLRWMGKVNLEKNDIVFTMEAPLGNALLLPDSRKYILSQRVVAFKTKADVLNSFLIQIIWGDEFQDAIGKLATGSTAKGINQKSLRTIPVRLPNADEQEKIADCLSPVDDLITAQSQKVDALKTHKQGLMQQLFPVLDEAQA